MTCGELCKTCKRECKEIYNEHSYNLMECVKCDGSGEDCDCEDGYVRITSCPKQYVGNEIFDAAYFASCAESGFLPIEGGVLDQSKWFTEAWNAITTDQRNIQHEQRQRHE